MPTATLETSVPPSRNKTQHWRAKQAAKRALQTEIQLLLLAAHVPRPIPGDRVYASAVFYFPTNRRRDEDNYRDGLSKALGDALSPNVQDHAPWRWLSDDGPANYLFGRGAFAVDRTRTIPYAKVTLYWGADIPAAEPIVWGDE